MHFLLLLPLLPFSPPFTFSNLFPSLPFPSSASSLIEYHLLFLLWSSFSFYLDPVLIFLHLLLLLLVFSPSSSFFFLPIFLLLLFTFTLYLSSPLSLFPPLSSFSLFSPISPPHKPFHFNISFFNKNSVTQLIF